MNAKKIMQYKYQCIYEDGWYYLLEFKKVEGKNFADYYIRKSGYGDYMYMFGIYTDKEDIIDILNNNKGLYKSCYNELHYMEEE